MSVILLNRIEDSRCVRGWGDDSIAGDAFGGGLDTGDKARSRWSHAIPMSVPHTNISPMGG